MKTCTKCRKTKPLDEFDLNKRSRDGRTAACKACNSAWRRAHYATNRERMRAKACDRMRDWRTKHPKRARESATRNSQTFREANPTYHREWYQRNADKERERQREAMRQWRASHPEEERERKRRYRTTNLQAVQQRERENTHRRRALMASSSLELAAHMAQLLKEPCDYCKATTNISIDHVVPLSRGGQHEATNLAPACVACNCSKGSRLLEEWLLSA